jgi:ubiquinone/menaquinone biosynthesis C-methylase UbiE
MTNSEVQQQQADTTAATAVMESARAQAFLGRMVGILNDAGLALMCSIGHQTGLFDTMASLPPSSSEQIAAAGGLTERYVREWLGAMVTGRIVDYDPKQATYSLPPDHAFALTRAARPTNLTSVAQFLPLVGSVEEQVVECFHHGGGVPYSEYPRFQQVMADASAGVLDASLVSEILPLVPGLTEQLQAGIDVLDVGCGRGHAIILMARAFPASRFTGLDFSAEALEQARTEASALDLSNARFGAQDVATLDASRQFDFITAFDCIHDLAEPRRTLKTIAAALRPDGVFLMVDVQASTPVEENIEHPMGPMLYTISCLHCMTVSLSQGGEGLGSVWGEQQATQLLHDAGFAHVEIKHLPTDMHSSYYFATTE